MSMKQISLVIAFFFAGSHLAVHAQTALEHWRPGYMDIHQINTGKGESSFFVFPDGTTMLLDAGAAGSKKPWATDPKPDGSKSPGTWIAEYIKPLLEQTGNGKIDYFMLSHFHWDHMGNITDQSPQSSNGAFKLSGITEVGELLPFSRMIDRGWPNYDWPVPQDAKNSANYIAFVQSKVKHEGVAAEQIRVGSNKQVTLVHHPADYPAFEVRNIAANGHVWTGVDSVSRSHIPDLKDLNGEIPSENNLSIALRISYGKFDYFTGADIGVRDFEMAGPLEYWKDIETPIAVVTGPVEAMKANHHGNYDANSVPFLRMLRPRVIVIPTWGASQPAMSVYRRMISEKTFPGERDIFVTNIMEETRTTYNVDKLKGDQGHVVIRVYPDGKYEVVVLDDNQPGHVVKERFGPYLSN